MAIDVQEVLADLPGDPVLALMQIVERLEKIIATAPRSQEQRSEYLYDAVVIAQSWCERNHLGTPSLGHDNSQVNWDAMLRHVRKIDRENRVEVIDEHVKSAAEGNYLKFGYAKLDPTEKEEIHLSLSHIRQIIEESELPDNKKNALYAKLNELAAEVDRAGTKTDAFFGLVGDLGIHLGQFGKNAKPLRKEITKVLKVITRSRARAEDVALPGGEEFPLLQAPEDEPLED